VIKFGQIKAEIAPSELRFMVLVVENCISPKTLGEDLCHVGDE
jgi:hypothetical protein